VTRAAVTGLGAMGRRMARRLAAGGHEVIGYARSGVPDEARPHLASVAATPREAAERADVVLVMVRDDEASRAVTLGETGALAGMRRGGLLVEHGTSSLAWSTALAGLAEERGIRFLDAPVLGSRPQAEAGALVVLAGGALADVEAARPTLLAYASAVFAMGATPAGSAAKLLVNVLFAVQVATFAELLPLAKRAGVNAASFDEVLAASPVVSPAARAAVASMYASQFAPLFPVELAEKDLGYAVAMGGASPMTRAAREVLAAAVRAGHGGEHLTAVAKLYRP